MLRAGQAMGASPLCSISKTWATRPPRPVRIQHNALPSRALLAENGRPHTGNVSAWGDFRLYMDAFASRNLECWVAEPIGVCSKCQNNIATADSLCAECWRELESNRAHYYERPRFWALMLLAVSFLLFWLTMR